MNGQGYMECLGRKRNIEGKRRKGENREKWLRQIAHSQDVESKCSVI